MNVALDLQLSTNEVLVFSQGTVQFLDKSKLRDALTMNSSLVDDTASS